jgi:hypothetical protein
VLVPRRQRRAKSFFRSFSILYGLDVASDGNGYDFDAARLDV